MEMDGVGSFHLKPSDLIPAEWQASEPSYVFNPAIVADGDGYIAFYRVVRADLGRRIAACRLDAHYHPVPGSARPFSDAIGADNDWYADPRLYVLRGRLYVYWNTGLPAKGENEQYLVEVDRQRCAPTGAPLRLVLEGPRQRIEKNWILFESDDDIWAIYSIAPHRILKVSHWSADQIRFGEAATTYWNSTAVGSRFGEPRGGAQPIRHGNYFYHFCHASRRSRHGTDYVAQCYEFEATAPFALRRFTVAPLTLPNPLGTRFSLPKLNEKVRSVVYPAGNLTLGETQILIAYGVNDEAAFLAEISFAKVEAQLRPVRQVDPKLWTIKRDASALRDKALRKMARLLG